MRLALLLVLALIPLLQRLSAQSANPGFTVRGRVVDSPGHRGAAGVEIFLPDQKRMVLSGADGEFSIDGMLPGIFTLCIRADAEPSDTLRLYADPAHPVLPDIQVQRPAYPEPAAEAIPEIVVQAEDAGGGIGAGDYAPAAAGRNPFTSAAAFGLFPFRFRERAYSRSSQDVLINALPVHDPASLNLPWNSWSGITEAFRNRDRQYGLGMSDAAFGGLAGTLAFDLTAASRRPRTRLRYALANRSYRNSLSYSRSSGLLPSGWAWAVEASYRLARVGVVPGTFYEGASLYAGISRAFGPGSLHLSVCGAWSQAGHSAAVTEETVRLTDNAWYNPNWGLQEGRVRNARVSSGFQPFAILTHQYRPGKRFRLETSLLTQAGRSGISGLDYYNAANPRPDYYRYLPSYLQMSGRDPELAAFYSRPQIDWDELYQQNLQQWDSIQNAGGQAGNTVRGRRSVYVLYRDMQALRKIAAGSNLQWRPGRAVRVNAGLSAISQSEERYRELADLLGGEFYVNTDPFQNAGAGRLAQYDIGVPDRLIRKGDRYGFDYIARSRESSAWTGLQATLGRFDLHLGGRWQYRGYQREGRFRSGVFPESSFGPGSWLDQAGLMYKGGLSYRLSGRSLLSLQVLSGNRLPGFDQLFIAPRVRNTVNELARPEALQGLECGLAHRSPGLHLHLAGFATRSSGGVELRRYYSDDPAFASFVNCLTAGVSKQYTGIEAGAELRLGLPLTLRLAVSATDAFYAANPEAMYIYGDSDTAQVPLRREVFLENLALASGPQTAGTLGIEYRSAGYWYAGLTVNYAARNYVDVNPERRSEAAIQGLERGSAAMQAILDQERLPAAYTIDASAGRNWLLSQFLKRLPRGTYLYLNASLSNLLDRSYRSGGYEQLRFDFAGRNPQKFASKYYYAPGRNFLLSMSLRW